MFIVFDSKFCFWWSLRWSLLSSIVCFCTQHLLVFSKFECIAYGFCLYSKVWFELNDNIVNLTHFTYHESFCFALFSTFRAWKLVFEEFVKENLAPTLTVHLYQNLPSSQKSLIELHLIFRMKKLVEKTFYLFHHHRGLCVQGLKTTMNVCALALSTVGGVRFSKSVWKVCWFVSVTDLFNFEKSYHNDQVETKNPCRPSTAPWITGASETWVH